MTGETEEPEWRAVETIPIHFDLPGHQIPLQTFIGTAEQTEAIIRSLNREFFDGKLNYEIFVLPPEHGTFKSKLGLVLLGGAATVWGFVESDVGSAFIKGLTAHEPAYWAELAGSHARAKLVDDTDDTIAQAEATEHDLAEKSRCGAVIILEVTKSFLQKDLFDLEQIGLTTVRFRDAFEARNEFYKACTETTGLRGIGFEEAPHFPIGRSDFIRLQVVLPQKEEDTDELWLTGTAILQVTSPNWDREDRQRFWKGKDEKSRERYFRITDEYFWRLVKSEQLNTHIIDTIKVQWAHHGKADNPRNIHVLKVLEFNGEVLSEPLDENALSTILGRFVLPADTQGKLFD